MIPTGQRVTPVVMLILLAGSIYFLPLASWITALVEWGQQQPVAGPLVYVGFVALAIVLFLPGSIAMMIGGFLFGFAHGFLFAALAVPLGAQGAFQLGRWVARPLINKRLANHRGMQAIEAALRDKAFVIVVLTRLSLIIPFNLLNYAYGASSVNTATYCLATAIGMLPAVALYVYLGTLARDIGQILSGQVAPSQLGYWIFGAGIATIIAATWVVHRTATRALNKHLVVQQGANKSE